MITTTKAIYLTHIKAGLEEALMTYEEDLQQWRESIDPNSFFGYNPPATPVFCADAEAFLYAVEGNIEYARRARERLVTYRQFTDAFPSVPAARRPEYADGLPPIPNFFVLPHYIRAYQGITSSGVLSDADHRTIQQIVADSVSAVFRFPEWGAHNRTALRAAGLAGAALAFPQHPEAHHWRQMARTLAHDSIGRWSIEDASLYHPIWTYAMILYADLVGERDFFHAVTTRYYFDYYLALLAPSGGIADFGDADWRSSWPYYIVCFERGAREYRDPKLRYAACRVYSRMWEEAGRPANFGSYLYFIDAYHWVDEHIVPEEPDTGSQEVLEDLVGKKVVFRNGWDDHATFLLLNYKPETDYGYTPREYLKRTICVEAEKAHHGHSDENAVCLLMHDGAVLLHDAGYRERLPNGKYRADLYHNRIVVRRGEPRERTRLIEFLQDGGVHKPAETQKIDFITFEQVDMSRTRVIDRNAGYQWDRAIVYLKQEPLFVIFDGVEFLSEGQFTLSNLFYTRQVLKAAPGYFDTHVDRVREYQNQGDQALLIWFAQTLDRWEGTDETRRYYQDERLVHQTMTATYQRGDLVAFCTVLVPHSLHDDVEMMARRFRRPDVDRWPRAVGLEILTDDGTITVGIKLDLSLEILTQNIRPRYDWESGRTRYGAVETDARFVYCHDHGGVLDYAFTEGVRVRYQEQEVFAAKPCGFPLQFFGSETQSGTPKWRAWESQIRLRRA